MFMDFWKLVKYFILYRLFFGGSNRQDDNHRYLYDSSSRNPFIDDILKGNGCHNYGYDDYYRNDWDNHFLDWQDDDDFMDDF